MRRAFRGLITVLVSLGVAGLIPASSASLVQAAPPNSNNQVVLDTPLLVFPADGSTTSDSTPDLDWSIVPFADHYQVQVDNNLDFSSPEIDINVTATFTGYTPPSPLANGTHFWRVQAMNISGDFSAWTAPWTLIIGDESRIDISLNSAWKFHLGDVAGAQTVAFNDSAWTQLDVPHTWNNLDGQDGGNNYFRGIGWYRKHYVVPAEYANKRIFIRFEAVSKGADVYVNGVLAGHHDGAFGAFVFDITSLVTIGADNVIAVKANNAASVVAAPISGDFNQDGGIFRPVHLIVTNKVHVTPLDFGSPGIYLTPTNVSASSADLNVAVKVDNKSNTQEAVSVQTIIKDANGTEVATMTSAQNMLPAASFTFSQNTTVANPHLWNGRSDPYLYEAVIKVKVNDTVVDQMVQPLGFRFFNVDPNTGFSLNGQPYDLHGVAIHEGRPNKGRAISDADRAEDMALLMEMGSTFVRLAHYQHAETTYDLTDANGLVVWTEIPIVNSISSSAAFSNNAQQQLKELIRQNYNHPSIFFWGLYNEIAASPSNATFITMLNTLAHAEDATRPTTSANHESFTPSASVPTDITAWNLYYGWYIGTLADATPTLNAAHGFHPALGVSEYGAGASIIQHEENPPPSVPGGLWHPEEYQNTFHESYWKQMLNMPYLWAKTIWVGFDFAVDSRNEGDTPGRNDKGMVTYDRSVKKDSFYWYKANWSDEPVVYITSRRFTPRDNNVVEVKVYSNCDSVELLVNAVSLGTLTSTDHIYRWTGVFLGSGNNTVNAVCMLGADQYQDSVVWDTGPALTALPVGLHQEVDNRIVYIGSWSTLGGIPGPGSTYMTNQRNAVAKFDFNGTELRLYRTIGNTYGAMQVCVDGVCQTVNNFNSVKLTYQMVTIATGLTNGVHRAVIRNLSTSFIDVDAVEVIGPLVAPVLTSPADGSTTADSTPTFDWDDIAGAVQYHIQVDNNSDFSSPEIDSDTVPSNYTPAAALPNGTYFWHVRVAKNGGWSSYSEVWSLTVAVPPSVPTLISPADGSVTANTVPAFDWGDVAGAAEYQVEVDDDADFSSPAISITTAASDYAPAAALGYHKYYWHVRASNGVWSDYSAAWAVTIATSPTLLSPKNGAPVYTNVPKLIWKPVTGAIGYRVRFENVADPGGVTETDVTPPDFLPGKLGFGTYKWQVAAQTADGWSDYSLPFTFDVTLNKAPRKNSAITTRQPVFTWMAAKNTGYHLRVWQDAGCGRYLEFEALTLNTSYPTPFIHRLDLGTYYWQVSPNGVDYTPCWRFVVTTLKSPKAGGLVHTNLPKFSWGTNKLAGMYRLTVELVPEGVRSAPIVVIDNLETKATKYSATARDGFDFGRYLWHVEEQVGGVYEPPTPDGEFFITNMIKPANDMFTLKGKISFAWAKVPGASTYELQVSQDPTDFDPPAFVAAPTRALMLTSPILPRGVYYWRIVTDNGNTMPTWTFTIGP